ncbi:hypothetical protein ANO14919_106710 [Xylariales sp. No.14919]|nr:hypothetical protein ANO14919_106710 [Xylariales sp. No.14919]
MVKRNAKRRMCGATNQGPRYSSYTMPLGRSRGHEMGALSQQGRSHGIADGRARQKNGSKSKDGIEYQAPGDEEDGDTGFPRP